MPIILEAKNSRKREFYKKIKKVYDYISIGDNISSIQDIADGSGIDYHMTKYIINFLKQEEIIVVVSGYSKQFRGGKTFEISDLREVTFIL